MTATNGANGAHGESGATEGHTNQQDTAFSTDASLQAHAKRPGGGPRRSIWPLWP